MNFKDTGDIEEILRPEANPKVRDLYDIWERRIPVSLADKVHVGATHYADEIGQKPGSGNENAARKGEDAGQIRWLQSDVSLVAEFTDQALRKEEFLLVCDACREAIAYWQDQREVDAGDLIKLHSDYALAKTRLGFTRDARKELEPHVQNKNLSKKERAKILLQLGDIVREESHHTAAPAARKATAEDAYKFYVQALSLDPKMLEAHVLSAAMSLIVSEKDTPRRQEAEKSAREALAAVEALEEEKPAFRTTWYKAVAYAVQGMVEEAAAEYSKLKDFPDASTSDLADFRYRSQFLAEALGEPRDFFKSAFPKLQLIVFTGHIPDYPGQAVRFPPELIPVVRDMLRKKLDELGARVGLVSAAAGADLLFIEALMARPGGEFHVVLPWSQKEFYRTSVEVFESTAVSPSWTTLFKQALDKAATIRELGQVFEPGDDVGWVYTQEVTAGLALLTARVSRLDLQPLALWDGKIGRGAGGTSSFVEFWDRFLAQPPIILKLPSDGINTRGSLHAISGRCERPTTHQQVKSMLFADIVGYSKLTEKVIRDFVEVFLQRLSKLLSESAHAPCHVNTWGDAVYAVFDYAEDAGRFALELTQLIRDGEKEWLRRGLFYREFDPEQGKVVERPLNIRIGLHTGPVFAHYNPVLRQLGFTGSHVSRAARIEPVATAGEVYASEEFAAMAELGAEIERRSRNATGHGSGDGFVCEYAGTMSLAKNYPGRHRIYRVIPHRVLVMEDLARAAHALYCEQERRRGKTAPTWEELDEDRRDANRAQVADIPNKLYILGYELAPSHGLPASDIVIAPEQLEKMAVHEHNRWMDERTRQGWTYGPVRDNARKHHPCLVPWEKLPEEEMQKDRDTVVNIPKLIGDAGFRVRRAARRG